MSLLQFFQAFADAGIVAEGAIVIVGRWLARHRAAREEGADAAPSPSSAPRERRRFFCARRCSPVVTPVSTAASRAAEYSSMVLKTIICNSMLSPTAPMIFWMFCCDKDVNCFEEMLRFFLRCPAPASLPWLSAMLRRGSKDGDRGAPPRRSFADELQAESRAASPKFARNRSDPNMPADTCHETQGSNAQPRCKPQALSRPSTPMHD